MFSALFTTSYSFGSQLKMIKCGSFGMSRGVPNEVVKRVETSRDFTGEVFVNLYR